MSPGWIKMHRRITEWEWYSDANACRVFLHLILTANWRPGRFKGEDVPAGGRITSYSNLGTPIGLSVQQTRTALDKLKSTGEITVKSTGFGLLVTVTKYASYNAEQDGEQQVEQQQDNSSVTDDQQQSNNNIRKKEGQEGEEGKKRGGPRPPLEIPKEWSEARKEIMQSWITYKKEKRNAYTPTGWKTLCKQIDRYPDTAVIAAVEKAMANNWQGLFPEKITNAPTIQALPPVHNKWQRTV